MISQAERQGAQLSVKKEEKSRQQKDIFRKREDLSGRSTLLDKECFRLNSQMEKLEETRDARISYMWDEYELTYSAALELKREDLGGCRHNQGTDCRTEK